MLHDLQIVGQAIEASVPEALIAFEPLEDISEGSGLEVAGAPLRLSATRNQARGFQHLQVLGNGRKAHVIRLGQLSHGGVAIRQSGKDSTPRGIAESEQGRAETV